MLHNRKFKLKDVTRNKELELQEKIKKQVHY